MNRNKGFTLIELLIVVAIIAILVVVGLGALKPRDAGAHELAPTGLTAKLAETGTSYRWASDTHTLHIIDKGSADWADSDAVCAALKGTVEHLHVTMRDNTGTGELRWDNPERAGETRVLTNLPTSTRTEC